MKLRRVKRGNARLVNPQQHPNLSAREKNAVNALVTTHAVDNLKVSRLRLLAHNPATQLAVNHVVDVLALLSVGNHALNSEARSAKRRRKKSFSME